MYAHCLKQYKGEIKLIHDTNEHLVVLSLDGCMSKDYTVQEMRETLNNMLVCLDDLEKWSYEKYYCALI